MKTLQKLSAKPVGQQQERNYKSVRFFKVFGGEPEFSWQAYLRDPSTPNDLHLPSKNSQEFKTWKTLNGAKRNFLKD